MNVTLCTKTCEQLEGLEMRLLFMLSNTAAKSMSVMTDQVCAAELSNLLVRK